MLQVRDHNRPNSSFLPHGISSIRLNTKYGNTDSSTSIHPNKENLGDKRNTEEDSQHRPSRKCNHRAKSLNAVNNINVLQTRRRPFRIRFVSFSKGTVIRNRPKHFHRPLIRKLTPEERLKLFESRPDLSPERINPFSLTINSFLARLPFGQDYTCGSRSPTNSKEFFTVRDLLNNDKCHPTRSVNKTFESEVQVVATAMKQELMMTKISSFKR